MYQLTTAASGHSEQRILSQIGTVHEQDFAAFGEFDTNPGEVYITGECLQGPQEGRALRAGPLPLHQTEQVFTALWSFMLHLRLPTGAWRLYIVDGAGKRLPGRPRTIAIKDES